MENSIIEIVRFRPEYQPWFEKLNRNWIEKFFWIEPLDIEILQYPDKNIIQKGGEIFMALYQREMAGTVALKFVEPGIFEFTKMAVDEKFQGKKIGEMLAQVAIQHAKQQQAKKIFLYSSTKLKAAIGLYRKLGFVEIPLDGPYKRSDIKMELLLSQPEALKTKSFPSGIIGLL